MQQSIENSEGISKNIAVANDDESETSTVISRDHARHKNQMRTVKGAPASTFSTE
jgi:hypothetical protein